MTTLLCIAIFCGFYSSKIFAEQSWLAKHYGKSQKRYEDLDLRSHLLFWGSAVCLAVLVAVLAA